MGRVWLVCLAIALLAADAASAETGAAQPADSGVASSASPSVDLALDVGVRANGSSLSDSARLMEGVILGDLQRLGLVNPVSAPTGASNGVDSAPDFASLSGTGADLALYVVLSPAPGGAVQTDFRLWDVARQENLLGLQFRAQEILLRRIAHRIADSTLRRLGGNSEFDSRIVAVERASSRLMVMDADGANPAYLTRGGGDAAPAFSGSNLIVFASEGGLSLFNLATGRTQRLLDGVDVIADGGVASAGAPAIAVFVLRGVDGESDIASVALRAPSEPNIIAMAGSQVEPTLASDGQRIAFLSGLSGARRITVSDLRGQNVQTIGPAGDYRRLAWSPVRDEFALVRRTEAGEELVLVGMDGSVQVLATGESFGRPSWSPGGSMLLITSPDRIETFDIATHRRTRIPSGFSLTDATWSAVIN